MATTFTKKDLQTGDIIQTRDGGYGVVILEKGCILYQAGGLEELEDFTDDLFFDGPEREADIIRVYSDPEGPIGFTKRFGIDPVFRRKNDKKAKQRAEELNDKYNKKKRKVRVIILEPFFRKYKEVYADVRPKPRDLDIAISEAPSMTVCGQLKIDRTFVPVPDTENLFILYNKYQEEWHLERDKRDDFRGLAEETEPMVVIPEENIHIHSRCMIVRMNSEGAFEELSEEDFEMVKGYLNGVSKAEARPGLRW